jgi:aspartate/methionine/tyrosine aminotransferase
VAGLRADLIVKRDRLLSALRALPGVEAPEPEGGMYVFFRLAGFDDSVATAKALIATVGLGLAPGSAFGDEGEGWLRWCFAAETRKLEAGIARFTDFVRQMKV